MMELLREKLEERETVTYQELASTHKRRVVAGAFFEVLQLKTWGRIHVSQASPFGTIEISKTEKFYEAIPA